MSELQELLKQIRTISENMGYTEDKLDDLVEPVNPAKHRHHNQTNCKYCRGALDGKQNHYALGRLLHPED